MKKVISASRRTDLTAFFPEWLASVLEKEEAVVYGPSGRTYTVNLRPDAVHSIVLWSKDFGNLITNRFDMKDLFSQYDQLYFHFTITGLGGTFVERGVPTFQTAVQQLPDLVKIAGIPDRISVRFDPIVYWKDRDEICTNLPIFEEIAPFLRKTGIKDVRISFAQWYNKAKKRAAKHNFPYVDPHETQKMDDARFLVEEAQRWGLDLHSCSQDFLAEISGIRPSSCIDGLLLQKLHPAGEAVSQTKDRTQRAECRCTESVDIGSYTQFCPHSCLYCYANPKI